MRVRVIPLAFAIFLGVPFSAAAAVPHVVAPGESLSSVAAADGLSVEELAAANGLPPEALLVAGSTLMVPPQARSATEAPSADTAEAAPGTQASAQGSASPAGASYVVQPGDTLSAIAARAGTSVEDLSAANGVDPNAPLLAGTVLSLPGAAGEASRPESAGPGAEASSSAPPYLTPETVSPSEVGSIAAENGVPQSLAEAIAAQESGFNNDLSSSADARGVMQILPSTWSWINETLAGPEALAPASAASNIRGGVLFLNALLKATGGDEALAAAGYFQGLQSVRSEGELPATREYVESVRALQAQFG